MRRILLSTLMLLGVAVGTAVSPASAQDKLDKLSVRLDFSPWGVQAAMHLAQNKGWFKAAGLDVDIQDGRGSGSTIQLVNAGQADVGHRVSARRQRPFAPVGKTGTHVAQRADPFLKGVHTSSESTFAARR